MNILEFLYIIIDAFIIIYGTEIVINTKTDFKIKLLFTALNVIAGSITFLPIQYANQCSTASGIVLYLIYLILITKNKRENIVIGIIWFIGIGMISVGFNYLIITKIGIGESVGRHIVIIICKLTIITFLYIIYLIKNKNGFFTKFVSIKENSNFKFKLRKEIVLLLLFYLIILVLLFVVYFMINKMNLYTELQHVINIILIAIIALMVVSFIFIKVMTKLYSTILSENEMNNYLTKEMEIISKSKNDYEKLQIVRHDLKHYLSVVKEMLNVKSKDEICIYIDDVVDVINDDAKYRVKLDDKLLESVINTKLDDMRKENIKVHSFIINYSNYKNVNNIAIILMNLLDNAKEAALRCDEKREVTIKSMFIGEYIKFEITNTCPIETDFNIDNIKTSKENKNLHGLGLKSVLSIIEEENGIIDFNNNGEIFVVNLLLPK